MYGVEALGRADVQLSISELSVVGLGMGGCGWVDGTNALHGRTWWGSDKHLFGS